MSYVDEILIAAGPLLIGWSLRRLYEAEGRTLTWEQWNALPWDVGLFAVGLCLFVGGILLAVFGPW